jgi:hypothetical protein
MNFKEQWSNILSNIGAIFVFAQAMYPGLNAEMIMASVANGTFIQSLINMGTAYMLVGIGKPKPHLTAPANVLISASELPPMVPVVRPEPVEPEPVKPEPVVDLEEVVPERRKNPSGSARPRSTDAKGEEIDFEPYDLSPRRNEDRRE